MQTESNLDLKIPQRQSPVAILVIVQRLFWTIVRGAWPLIVVWFINPQSKFEVYMTLIGIGAVTLSTIGSLISYFTFYFHLEETALVMKAGLFNKTNRNIPFDRIQTVNFTQNIIHRIFDVVQLDIDTAGSSKNELAIKALSRSKANEIRDFILKKKAEQKTLSSESELLTEEAENNSAETFSLSEIDKTTNENVSEKTLLALSIPDLLKVGVSQNHFRTVGIILATLFGFSQFLQDILGKDTDTKIVNYIIGSFMILIAFVILLFIAAFILTLINTVLRYYDLRFIQTAQGFKITSGLFTRTEQSAQLQKIQLVEWTSNPIKRYFKLYTLYLKQAASSAIALRQTISIPGCYMSQIETVRETYFPNFDQIDWKEYAISPLIIGRYTLYYGVIPIMIFTGIKLMDSWWAVLHLFWIIPIYFLARKYHEYWKYAVSEEGLFLKKGILGQHSGVLRWFKVQAVTLKQSPYQRRKNLATLVFSTAGGKMRLPYIELKQAVKLRDFVLYEIERKHQKWM